MNIILIRHGESEADILNVLEGRADFPLTSKGLEQATSLSKWLNDNELIDVLLSSPLKRARQTASLISKETGKEIVICDELMEWDNGLLAGFPREWHLYYKIYK